VKVIDLIGKLVIVETEETMYTGKLIEVGEEEVHLESEMGWVVIPMQRVTSIREK
jgi:ribosome maturation factor RimP